VPPPPKGGRGGQGSLRGSLRPESRRYEIGVRGGYARRMPGLGDFDRYVEAHGIPVEDYPAAFALWAAETTGGRSRASNE
jgi:hypothetical protein